MPVRQGKTWLAKRLAFALMGQRGNSKVRAVQFHPNLSYEDFEINRGNPAQIFGEMLTLLKKESPSFTGWR